MTFFSGCPQNGEYIFVFKKQSVQKRAWIHPTSWSTCDIQCVSTWWFGGHPTSWSTCDIQCVSTWWFGGQSVQDGFRGRNFLHVAIWGGGQSVRDGVRESYFLPLQYIMISVTTHKRHKSPFKHSKTIYVFTSGQVLVTVQIHNRKKLLKGLKWPVQNGPSILESSTICAILQQDVMKRAVCRCQVEMLSKCKLFCNFRKFLRTIISLGTDSLISRLWKDNSFRRNAWGVVVSIHSWILSGLTH
jgi:hypothetical protein